MRRRRLALAAAAIVALSACSSDDKSPSPSSTVPLVEATTTTLPPTPVVATIESPESGSVQGSGGRGFVVVLTFTAVDPSALPAQFRLGGDLPAPATRPKPGRNPAFPGLVVGTTATPASLGGPDANLANLFQIVSPSPQPDGSTKVTAIWTNTQSGFATDVDITLGAVTVAGSAPDVILQPLTQMNLSSNVASVNFRLSAAEAGGVGVGTTTSSPTATSTTVRSTTTTRRATTTTAGATATTTTTVAATTTTLAPTTTSTTKFLGLF